MCTNSNSNGTGLTRGQEILDQANVAELIKTEISRTIAFSLVPKTIFVSDFFYKKLKAEFCIEHKIDNPDSLDLKMFENLPLVNRGAERNFSENGEFCFPLRVSYSLPAEQIIVHQLRDDADDTKAIGRADDNDN
jgi:hypothetical protein